MKTLPLKSKFIALSLVALLLGTLSVMSAYIPDEDHNHLMYGSSEEFIRVLVVSAFRLD